MADAVYERDEVALRKFVEHMAMTLNDMGFPRMPSRVLITLMAADEEALAAGELAERLEVSPAAISGAVRYLLGLGMIVREPSPGSRRELYALPPDAWYEATAVKVPAIKLLADLATQGLAVLGGESTPSGRRMAEMADFLLFCVDDMNDLIERWRAHRAAQGFTP
jgi:predicted transcriptional regulator